MANTYDPKSLGIAAPAGGFQQGGWYNGRQYWGGTLSDPGVEHPSSGKATSGQVVSAEVNAQSAAAQGVSSQQLESYLQSQRDQQAKAAVQPAAIVTPSASGSNFGAASTSGGSTDLGSLFGTTATSTLNLPDLYKSLYASAGIDELQKTITDKKTAYDTATSTINDNPYLSEGNRTGRISKLTTDYENSIKTDTDTLAMKKADIETQLNLQTKQFDINSTTSKQALDTFNTLLSSGALDNASGTDIAAITKATGISSSMIQSAISANSAKNATTQVITSTADDGTVTATVINTKTGAVVNKTNLGKIGNAQVNKPTETDVNRTLNSKAVQLFNANANSYGDVSPAVWQKILAAYIQDGGNTATFQANFGGYADTNRGDFENAYGFKNPAKYTANAPAVGL